MANEGKRIPQCSKLCSSVCACANHIVLTVDEIPVENYLNVYVRGNVCAAGREKWRDLGIELMGQEAANDLDIISVNLPNDVEARCSKMFTKWRERMPEASWKKLIEALKVIKLIQLASELERLLIPSMKHAVDQEKATSQQPTLQELEGILCVGQM